VAKRSEPAPRVAATEAPAAAPAPTPSPAITPQANADRAAAGAAPSAVAEAESSSERRQLALARDASEPAAKAAAPGAAAAPVPRAPATAFALRRETAGAAPIGPLRAAIAAEPGRWFWQRDSGARQPLSPALTQWLRQLDDATRGRWQPDGSNTSASDTEPAFALWRDDRPHGRLRLDATGVSFELSGSTAPQRAALSAAEASALREAFDQATR
jgi:hypothetical protein